MTEVVVEVGPAAVRGPNHVDADWVWAGIDGIDDELALIGEHVVTVTEVWRKIMRDVVAGSVRRLVVVCPTWWSSSRVERVRGAASALAEDVVVKRRAALLSERYISVVELASEVVVVWSEGAIIDVMRPDDTDALISRIPASVVVDAPHGVEDIGALVDRLRANGIHAAVVDRDWVLRNVDARRSPGEGQDHVARPSPRRSGSATAVLAGTLVSAAVLGGLAVRHNSAPAADVPTTLLVEGRVGVMVPAQWVVQRVTSGPGSTRVQIVSGDADIALHLTQSSLPPQQSHEQMADSLRDALDQEPDGVFVDFNPSDTRAGRSVVTYREIRPEHEIAWIVLIDRTLRIAVGCQSAPGHEETVRQVCDRAIGSAHAVS